MKAVDSCPKHDQVSNEKLVEVMLSGGQEAVEKFLNISGEYWFGAAPEYYLTTGIGNALEEIEQCYVRFEVKVGEVRQQSSDSGTRPGPQPKSKKQRYDIVVDFYDAKKIVPRIVVEVKTRVWGASGLEKDCEKLAKALKHKKSNNKICCGMIIYYAQRGHKDNEASTIEALQKTIKGVKGSVAKHMKKQCENISVISAESFIGRGGPAIKYVKPSDHSGGGAWVVTGVVFHT